MTSSRSLRRRAGNESRYTRRKVTGEYLNIPLSSTRCGMRDAGESAGPSVRFRCTARRSRCCLSRYSINACSTDSPLASKLTLVSAPLSNVSSIESVTPRLNPKSSALIIIRCTISPSLQDRIAVCFLYELILRYVNDRYDSRGYHHIIDRAFRNLRERIPAV